MVLGIVHIGVYDPVDMSSFETSYPSSLLKTWIGSGCDAQSQDLLFERELFALLDWCICSNEAVGFAQHAKVVGSRVVVVVVVLVVVASEVVPMVVLVAKSVPVLVAGRVVAIAADVGIVMDAVLLLGDVHQFPAHGGFRLGQVEFSGDQYLHGLPLSIISTKYWKSMSGTHVNQ